MPVQAWQEAPAWLVEGVASVQLGQDLSMQAKAWTRQRPALVLRRQQVDRGLLGCFEAIHDQEAPRNHCWSPAWQAGSLEPLPGLWRWLWQACLAETSRPLAWAHRRHLFS